MDALIFLNSLLADYYYIDPNGPLNGIQDAFQVYCRFHEDMAESCVPAGPASVSFCVLCLFDLTVKFCY